MRFQYDPAKAKSNFKKHRVSFADADGVFYDDLALHMEDFDAEDEERWIAVGMGSANQILVVVYTLRGDEIRLISVRRATRREVQDYEERI
ncbi:MAG: BrnT family toxin [Caldilineaceae bacterium]|nr:BrnT family toxin [Caldilineaceae bacterium]